MKRDVLAEVLGMAPASVANIGRRFGISRSVHDYTDEQVGQIIRWAKRPKRSPPARRTMNWLIQFGGNKAGGTSAKVSHDVSVYQRGSQMRGFVGMTDDQIHASLTRLGGRWSRITKDWEVSNVDGAGDDECHV